MMGLTWLQIQGQGVEAAFADAASQRKIRGIGAEIDLMAACLPSIAFAGISSTGPVSPTFARQWRWLDRDWGGAMVPGPFVSYASL